MSFHEIRDGHYINSVFQSGSLAMADSTASELSALLSNAVVSFSLDGRFPDAEQVSSLSLSASDLSPAIQALAQAKKDLEVRLSSFRASISIY